MFVVIQYVKDVLAERPYRWRHKIHPVKEIHESPLRDGYYFNS